jgi:hypothetical protein
MTPKEKAKELIKKFDDADLVGSTDWGGCAFLDTKKCALIAVELMIYHTEEDSSNIDLYQFYLEVKQEIEKL